MRKHLIGALGFVAAIAMCAVLVAAVGEVRRRVAEPAPADSPRPIAAREARAAERQASETYPAEYPRIRFEGILLAFSPGMRAECGIIFPHQVARYRVTRVLEGAYEGDTIVVDHGYCGEPALQGFRQGDRVELTVTVRPECDSATYYPGIRAEGEEVTEYFIAEEVPRRR